MASIHGLRSLCLAAALALLAPASGLADPAVRLATTTSTDNSGLLRALLPPFEERTGRRVHVIAVGTGKALRMGRDGDVDLVLVHAPPAEERFVAEGHGVNRRSVMHNDFVIVGPASDPAALRGRTDAARALAAIARSGSVFVSRGDDSGTHKKERALWQAAGVDPGGRWYREVGQGMGRVLQMAGELDGYTMTDRGTWLAMKRRLPLEILVAGDARLLNPYSVIAVNPARYPDADYLGAMAVIAWLTSGPGQDIIGSFKVDDELLFVPTAVPAQTDGQPRAGDG